MKPGSDRRWRRHGIVLRGGKSRGCFCGLPSFLAADGVDRSIEFSFPRQFPVRPHFPHVGIRVRRRSEPSKASATISARRLRRVFAFNGRLLGIVSSPPLESSSRTSSAVSAQNSASWCTDGNSMMRRGASQASGKWRVRPTAHPCVPERARGNRAVPGKGQTETLRYAGGGGSSG